MRLRMSSRAGAFVLLLACGCGSGGGTTPATFLTALFAAMQGNLEPTVVDGEARASAICVFLSDGTLQFAVAVESAWAPDVTDMHIHRGAAGVNGPIVVDLLVGGIVFDPVSRSAAGTLTIDPALAEEIAGNPAGFYVNVHTTDAPNGFARAQLGDVPPVELHAILSGAEESSQVDPDAHGAASFLVTGIDELRFVLAMGSPSIAGVTQAHIHAGGAGVDGGIVVDLASAPGVATDVAAGTKSGTVEVPLATLARILAEPGAFYVNAHSAAAPNGIARGQLGTGPEEVWAKLEGDEETTVVDPNASGGVALRLASFTQGTMMLAVPPSQDIASVTMAHLHAGAAGVNGAIVIDLLAGSDLSVSLASDSAEGSIAFDQALYTRILGNPAAFYGNVHTAAAPNGIARGQLTRRAPSYFTALAGANETTVVDPTAAGTLTVILRSLTTGSFTVRMIQPAASTILQAHIHDGAPGTNGPPLIDFLEAGDFTVAGDTISGDFLYTGRTFVRLLSNAGLFYGNVHTAAAPNGVARGQMQLGSDDVAPSGLAYSSPVSYFTGSAIDPNVPTSGGGAVSVYSVSPALPAGLSLDPTTGILSGTPTVPTPAANYTVTAANGAGQSTFALNITVLLAPPLTLAYSSPVTYAVGAAITPNTPVSTGGPISTYSVSPALPAGLALNTTTGVISGTPNTATAAANYTVTGSNSSGSVNFAVNIAVTQTLQAPSGLSYATPVSYSTGTAITPNTPTIGGGAVATWSITPALPSGLSFDTTNGVISGTPTAVTSAANYTVTASNASGSTQATVNIATPLGAPSNLSYTNDPQIAYQGQAIASMVPSSGGGAVSTYSISPALPNGLQIDATTGVISGTPTGASTNNYTVTASNASGSTQVTVTILVY